MATPVYMLFRLLLFSSKRCFCTIPFPHSKKHATRPFVDHLMEDAKALIDRCLSDPSFAQGRRAVKEETWQHFSQGAVLAADYLCECCDRLAQGEEVQRT